MHALPRRPVLGWASFGGAREAGLPSLLDAPQVVLTSSGSAAILLALEALGVVAGDRVLVPTYHCPTMVSPIHTLGAQPLFYPLSGHGMPDFDWLSKQDLRGVRAMLAAHFFGLPLPMDAVAAWCRERGFALVEDCAHALFGQVGGRSVGAWGAFAIGSLTKFLPVADGGCLVANGAKRFPPLVRRARAADCKAALDAVELGALHGRLRGAGGSVTAGLRLLRRVRGAAATAGLPDDQVGVERSASKLDVALSHSGITRPSGWLARCLPRARIVERRRRHYACLARRLAASSAVRPLMPALPDACAPYVFPLWVERPDPGYAALRRAGVPVYRWDTRWPNTPAIPGDFGPVWSHHVLQIGCHQDLTDNDIDHIADVLQQVFEFDGVPLHHGA